MSTIDLWSSSFGDEYTERNAASAVSISARRRLFFDMLPTSARLRDIVEIGAGSGANLRALRTLMGPAVRLVAVEPNAMARMAIAGSCATFVGDVLDGTAESIPLPDASADLAFTSGVLIHIPPDRLGKAMDEIYRVSRRWIACIEYFSPDPVCVPYRGQDAALWKRDFGSTYLDRFPDLRSVAYGFSWKRETGLDNVTWHLLEKAP